ncbi:FUSC family protein [Mycobacterium sp.]|uniref:FUSC family protein n=1 Tax=Mycobacterium sp. TaxID=1785 RepID=UPI002CC124D0|nr:FUSC family protein [Mycobacterium sp.]HME46861.1 FUSC family protein [Mycobacterium sp.]
MLTPAGLSRRAVDRVRTRDPERDALRRALRAAIVVPIAAGVSFLAVGGTQAPLFTVIGSIWLMVLVDFPGTRQVRALAYCGLGLNGAVLIILGTLVQPIPWLAVTIMFVLGVAVTLAGVLSETIAAGQRATLLTYVLPVCTPPGPISERLVGWAIAWIVCVPAALFFLPPRHHGDLRRHAAQVCAALADRLEGVGSAAEVSQAMQALKTNFLSADYRPVGLSAGSRALVRVVDDLEWVSERLTNAAQVALADMTEPAVSVLRCCARALDAARVSKRTVDRTELDAALAGLRSVARGRYREDVVRLLAERDDGASVALGRELLTRRTIATTVGLTGRVIAAAAAADARPSWAKALGLRLPPTGAADLLIPETVAVTTITTGFLTTRSVAARNAVRTGVGLALAVATTHLFPIQHGFWVVLGAIVVLGSSALTTGTKVVRAMVGTAIGVVLGAVLIAAVGVDPVLLWTLLPIVIFGAAYTPRVASFTAGQATMTMMVLIVFNLIVPTGWRIGLLRIEDVMAGAAVAVAASLLLWPRGATASVYATIGAAVDVGARFLRAAVLRVTRGASEEIDDQVASLNHDALAASRTVDDALRHYLSESGGSTDLRAPVIRAANRAIRLRTAAEVIADIRTPPPLSAYPRTRAVLESHAESVAERLKGESDKTWPPVSDEFVLALRAEFTGDEAAVSAALPLVAVAANLGELELLYPAPAAAAGVAG